MTDEFKIGDTVTRINGATDEMEVVEITAHSVICQWFDADGEPERTAYNPWELKLVRMHDAG